MSRARMNSGDAARRRREREAEASGAPADEVRVLVERLRAGEIDPERVALAAVLGDEPSRLALPGWRDEIRPAWRGELTADAQIVLRPAHLAYVLSILRFAIGADTPIASAAFESSLIRSDARVPPSGGWVNTRHNAIECANRGDWPRALEEARLLATFMPAVREAHSRRDWAGDPEGPQTRAWAAELGAQAADMIALLLGRPLPRFVRENGGDEQRRRREREAAASGAPTDLARALIARLNAGELGEEGMDRIRLAAALGDEGARVAAPNWPAATEFATMSGRLPADDPFVLHSIADALRGYLRPWGPEVVREVYNLSGARLEDRLQARHPTDGRWRQASDRALLYMTQENFGAALESEAWAFGFLADGSDEHTAVPDEENRQRADMIAFLLRREPPREAGPAEVQRSLTLRRLARTERAPGLGVIVPAEGQRSLTLRRSPRRRRPWS